MADPTNPVGGGGGQPYSSRAPRPQQTGETPARTAATAAKDDLDSFADLASNAEKIKIAAESMSSLNETLKEAPELLRKTQEGIRRTAAASDTFAGTLRKTRDLLERLDDSTTFEDANETLKELLKTQQDLQKTGLTNPKHIDEVEKKIELLTRAQRALQKQQGQTYDPRLLEPYTRELDKLDRKLASINKHSQHLPQWLQKAHAQQDKLREDFGFRPAPGGRIHQIVSAGHERLAKFRDNQEAQRARFDTIKQQVAAGGPDAPKMHSWTKGFIAKHEEALKAAAEGQGKAPGVRNRLLYSAIQQGEGSLVKGVARSGLGLLGDIGGGALTAASGTMLLGGAGIALIDAFEKNQKMNATVDEQLGKGGLYGGANAPGASLRQMRNNLGTGYLNSVNMMGIGYEKNLALANAMVQGGFSVTNLANHPMGKDKDSYGMLQGSFGSFQRNAYAFGRLAGLSPTETMAQTIKLMTQYHQSLAATEDFFIEINKDTAAAGISTQKYIDLIDEVNSHYDRANKLLMTTVETMRMLGQTGRETADDMKDSLGALTNHGQKQDMPHAAYLYRQMLMSGDNGQSIIATRQGEQDRSVENAVRAMLGPKASQQDIDKRVAELSADVNTRGAAAVTTFEDQSDQQYRRDHDVTAQQNRQTAAKQLRTSIDKLTGARSIIGSGMNYNQQSTALATLDESTGIDMHTNLLQTMQTLKSLMSQFGLGDIGELAGKNRSKIMQDPRLVKALSEQFKMNPEEIYRTLPIEMSNIAATRMQMIEQGPNKNDTPEQAAARANDVNRAYQEMVRQGMGDKGLDTSGKVTPLQAMQDFVKNHRDEALQALSTQQSTYKDLFTDPEFMKLFQQRIGSQEKSEKEQAGVEANQATASMAKTFADAFENLFNNISEPLDWIRDILVQWRGAPTQYQNVTQQTMLDTANQSYKGGDSIATRVERRIQQKIDQTKGFTNYQPLKAELADFTKTETAAAGGAGRTEAEAAHDIDVLNKYTTPQELLDSMHLNFDQAGVAKIKPDQEKLLHNSLAILEKAQLIDTPVAVTDPNTGKITNYNVTTHNYSTSTTVTPPANGTTTQSAEAADNRPKLVNTEVPTKKVVGQ